MRKFRATNTKDGETYTWSMKMLEKFAQEDGIIEHISDQLNTAMMETHLIADEDIANDTFSDHAAAAALDVFRNDPVRWWNDRSKTWTSPQGIRPPVRNRRNRRRLATTEPSDEPVQSRRNASHEASGYQKKRRKRK